MIRGDPKATWEYIFCSPKRSEPPGAELPLIVVQVRGHPSGGLIVLAFARARGRVGTPMTRGATKIKTVLGSKIEGKTSSLLLYGTGWFQNA